MKTYFNVTFRWSEDIWCANIAHAESEAAVKLHYSKYSDVTVTPASAWDVESARERGKPIIEC